MVRYKVSQKNSVTLSDGNMHYAGRLHHLVSVVNIMSLRWHISLSKVLARAAALQSVAVRRSTGNDVSGHYFRRYFLFFFFSFFPVVNFSHRRNTRIKKLI